MHLLDLLFPKRCVGCRRIGAYFCPRCSLHIRTIEFSETICPVCEKSAIGGRTHPRCRKRYTIDGLTSFFHYDGIIRKAIKAIKYRYVSDMIREFMSLIPSYWIDEIRKHIKKDEVVIPVPLHPGRFRERGFNQAEIIGRLLASELDANTNSSVLIRHRFTHPQVEMTDRKTRLKNMEGVFALKGNMNILSGKYIILVDDVFTTGATLRSAARVLKHAGVRSVWGVTIAR